MKCRLFLLAAAVLMSACAPKDPNTFTVKGEVKGLDGEAYMFVRDDLGCPPGFADTVRFENGRFSYRGTVEHPMIGHLIHLTPDWDISVLGVFVAEPGAKLKLEGDMSLPSQEKGYVSGNRTNDRLAAFLREADKIVADGYTPENVERWTEMSWKFIGENLDNMGGVFMFVRLNENCGEDTVIDGAEEWFAKFTPEMQQLPIMVETKDKIERVKEKEKMFGKGYREIVSSTPNGKEIKLSETIDANRYTLLDFWASWCQPCIGEMPYLREAYAEYKNKGFEIFAVSLDDDAKLWKKYIKEHDMTWLHAGSMQGWGEPAAKLYEIKSIPANFLIDRDGNIVARHLRGKALSDKLEELLK